MKKKILFSILSFTMLIAIIKTVDHEDCAKYCGDLGYNRFECHGTAPFCGGACKDCKTGYAACGLSLWNDCGRTCWTGSKACCCYENSTIAIE